MQDELIPPSKRRWTEPPFLGHRPVFIGDDSTDEHGFMAANKRGGISIGVGPDCINARYTLPDVSAVRAWLAAVQDASALIVRVTPVPIRHADCRAGACCHEHFKELRLP